MYINDHLYTESYHLYEDFFLLIKNNLKKKNPDRTIQFNMKSIWNWIHLGTDKRNNSYWSGQIGKINSEKRIIIVFTKQGNCIDIFYNKYGRTMTVSKQGDIIELCNTVWAFRP